MCQTEVMELVKTANYHSILQKSSNANFSRLTTCNSLSLSSYLIDTVITIAFFWSVVGVFPEFTVPHNSYGFAGSPVLGCGTILSIQRSITHLGQSSVFKQSYLIILRSLSYPSLLTQLLNHNFITQ